MVTIVGDHLANAFVMRVKEIVPSNDVASNEQTSVITVNLRLQDVGDRDVLVDHKLLLF